MPASNTAQSNTKDGFEESTAKTQSYSKVLDCKIHDSNDITANAFLGKQNQILHSFINTIPCGL